MSAIPAIEAAYAHGWEPDPDLTVSEWTDRYRTLSTKDSPMPGPMRTSSTPYMRAIQDAASARTPYETVVLVKCAQIGFTAALLNVVGYRMQHMPGPLLIVQPNLDPTARRFSKQRLDPMIASTDALRAMVRERRQKGDASNTILQKDYPGGTCIIAGANSAAGLRSMPVRDLLLDEVDAYPASADDEGDPVDLAVARTSAYPDSKLIVMGSTPTIEGRSRIMREVERCDRVARYHVPCPHCHHLQPLEWERLRIKASPVVYECAGCGEPIEERHKRWMLADQRDDGDEAPGARWVLERDKGDESIAFVDLSALYAAPGLGPTWADLAAEFFAKKEKPQQLRVFINTRLARTWKERYEQPAWRPLYARADGYPRGTVPEPPAESSPYLGPCFLTAGVDVGADRLEAEIVAWGREARSWSVQYLVLAGDPASPAVWASLEGLLGTAWPTAWGTRLPLRVMAIDTGYATERVYAFVRAHQQPTPGPAGSAAPMPGTVMAVKGTADFDHLVSPRVGKVADGRVHLWLVGTGLAKRGIYDSLRLIAPTEEERAAGAVDPPGYMRFPRYEEGWFVGLTSNRLVTHIRQGRGRPMWEKDPAERDEPLDCRVYARAAAHVFGIDRFTADEWTMAEQLARGGQSGGPPPMTPVVAGSMGSGRRVRGRMRR